jgi:hypothetical protein
MMNGAPASMMNGNVSPVQPGSAPMPETMNQKNGPMMNGAPAPMMNGPGSMMNGPGPMMNGQMPDGMNGPPMMNAAVGQPMMNGSGWMMNGPGPMMTGQMLDGMNGPMMNGAPASMMNGHVSPEQPGSAPMPETMNQKNGPMMNDPGPMMNGQMFDGMNGPMINGQVSPVTSPAELPALDDPYQHGLSLDGLAAGVVRAPQAEDRATRL